MVLCPLTVNATLENDCDVVLHFALLNAVLQLGRAAVWRAVQLHSFRVDSTRCYLVWGIIGWCSLCQHLLQDQQGGLYLNFSVIFIRQTAKCSYNFCYVQIALNLCLVSIKPTVVLVSDVFNLIAIIYCRHQRRRKSSVWVLQVCLILLVSQLPALSLYQRTTTCVRCN